VEMSRSPMWIGRVRILAIHSGYVPRTGRRAHECGIASRRGCPTGRAAKSAGMAHPSMTPTGVGLNRRPGETADVRAARHLAIGRIGLLLAGSRKAKAKDRDGAGMVPEVAQRSGPDEEGLWAANDLTIDVNRQAGVGHPPAELGGRDAARRALLAGPCREISVWCGRKVVESRVGWFALPIDTSANVSHPASRQPEGGAEDDRAEDAHPARRASGRRDGGETPTGAGGCEGNRPRTAPRRRDPALHQPGGDSTLGLLVDHPRRLQTLPVGTGRLPSWAKGHSPSNSSRVRTTITA